ncbi:cyanophycin metabolism-associated DUF1854 family protein [Methylotenera sp. G11]|uniref:cyanophycin metabolism-associated DUF1854 family protein n=1 Tax=Methylotenera sp. G11 TaxID=1506585 RepID=UPI0006467CFE|nr:DUF1854 domain-containing protein [Methylotenera sp. G11]
MNTIKSDIDFRLLRNSAGQLQFTSGNGVTYEDVNPVRAFPISAPDEGLSIISKEGHELAWIPDLAAIPSEMKTLIDTVLAQREFMPVILRIIRVSSFATPSTWDVETDKGNTQLILKAEDQIWRPKNNRLLITDKNGVNFTIGSIEQLDRHSRKLLDRFL